MLVQRVNPKTGRKEWALASRSNPKKILEWYGPQKPSEQRVAKSEKRVNFFKYRGKK